MPRIYLSPSLQEYNPFYGGGSEEEVMNLIADAMEPYLDPSKVQVLPTTTLRELRRTNAPSALVEVAYHDNPEDAAWIRGNIDEIGKALSNAVAAYFGLR